MLYTIYRTATGEVVQNGDCPEDWIPLQNSDPACEVITGYCDAKTSYVLDGEFVDRPSISPIADLSQTIFDSHSVSNIPSNTIVFINGENLGTVEDGDFEFACPVPGVYNIELRPPFPWIGVQYKVTVNAV